MLGNTFAIVGSNPCASQEIPSNLFRPFHLKKGTIARFCVPTRRCVFVVTNESIIAVDHPTPFKVTIPSEVERIFPNPSSNYFLFYSKGNVFKVSVEKQSILVSKHSITSLLRSNPQCTLSTAGHCRNCAIFSLVNTCPSKVDQIVSFWAIEWDNKDVLNTPVILGIIKQFLRGTILHVEGEG